MSDAKREGEESEEGWKAAAEGLVVMLRALDDGDHQARHETFISFGTQLLGFETLVAITGSRTPDGGGDLASAIRIAYSMAPGVPSVIAKLRAIADQLERDQPDDVPEAVVAYDSSKPAGQA